MGSEITPDDALLDSFRLLHGLWDTKDSAGNLTFETAEKAQVEFGFFNPENTERVKRQNAV